MKHYSILKNKILKALSALAVLTLFVQISTWFYDYDNETKHLINAVMFAIIGVSYLIFGFSLSEKITKLTLIACGLFLIVMNFIPKNTFVEVIGIICLIIPMLIGRFSKEIKEA